MKALVAVDSEWGIGYKGNLLQRIPEDMRYFKSMTLGKIVVMGRTTFESLPNKEPLKDRINIVLTRNSDFSNDRVTICHSLEDLFSEIEKYNSDDVFIIGGETIYAQLLPYCTNAYVTRIRHKYIADKYFTNIDENPSWKLVSQSDFQRYSDISYCFAEYVNEKVK